MVHRNTVNNPTGFKAGLPTMEAAAHANTDSGGMVERRRTQNEGDDAEELAQMTLYPDDVSGIIMKAQDFYLHFDEPNDPQNEGKAMLKDWLDLNQNQEMAVGEPNESKQGATHHKEYSVVQVATVDAAETTNT